MKEFGTEFDSYKALSIQHMAFPSDIRRPGLKAIEEFGVKMDSLPEIVPAAAPHVRVAATRGPSAYEEFGKAMPTPRPRSYRVLTATDMPDSLKKELRRSVVKVAPTANVYKMPKGKADLAEAIKNTMPYFDYYLVEMGLETLLNRGEKITEMLYKVTFKSDNPDETAVTAYDIAPDDRVKTVRVLGGKISLGITKLLQLIPSPVGQAIGNLLQLELNPWEFQWNIDRYEIDVAGKKDYKVYWRMYNTNLVQGFNPTLVLKVRKGVKRISAQVTVTYGLKTGLFDFTPDIKSRPMTVPIWPS